MNSNESLKEKYKIPDLHKSLLIGMLKIVVEIFEKNNIKYFADSGTLLGAVREQGQIPHDDDMDLGLFQQDYAKAKKIFSLLENVNINVEGIDYPVKAELDKYPCLMKLFVPDLWMNNQYGVIIATPTIDFFSFSKKGDKFKFESISTRQQFPDYFFYKSELLPLKKYKFEDIEIFGARDPIPCLKRYYGEDCLTTTRIDKRKDEGDPMQKNREAISIPL